MLSLQIDAAFCRDDRGSIMRGLSIEGVFAEEFGNHLHTASTYFVLGEDELAYEQILAEVERLPISYRENVDAYGGSPENTDPHMLWERSGIIAAGMSAIAHNRTPFEFLYDYDEEACRPGSDLDTFPPY